MTIFVNIIASRCYDEFDKQYWCYDLGRELINVFGFDDDVTHEIIRKWCDLKGVNWGDFSTTRKIRARWSPELIQDLQCFHSIDFSAELESLLTTEISREINSSIINDLITN